MKYIKLFESFESIGDDLKDILLEINDESLWSAESWYVSSQKKWVVIIKVIDEDEEYELEGQTPPPSVIESIERSIDFMNGLGFSNEITFEVDEDDQIEEIGLEDLSGLDVWPNNFIRIEFSK